MILGIGENIQDNLIVICRYVDKGNSSCTFSTAPGLKNPVQRERPRPPFPENVWGGARAFSLFEPPISTHSLRMIRND